jgi:hypothetical protein
MEKAYKNFHNSLNSSNIANLRSHSTNSSEINEKPTLPISVVSFKFSIPKVWVESELELQLKFITNGQVIIFLINYN